MHYEVGKEHGRKSPFTAAVHTWLQTEAQQGRVPCLVDAAVNWLWPVTGSTPTLPGQAESRRKAARRSPAACCCDGGTKGHV